MKIGAQLYTVHQHCKTLDDLDATLGKVAAIGYKTVQVSGTCAYDPVWMRDTLAKHGLTCAMTHVNPELLIEDVKKVVADHAVFNCKNIGIGGMPGDMRGSLEGYERFRKTFLPIAEQMRDLGVKLMYHNHWFEFNKLDGKDVIERIFEDFPADSINFTLDAGWAAFGGADVVSLIEKLSGQLTCIHLKDYKDLPADGSITTDTYLRPIYEGKLDYDAYINAFLKAGTEYALVEQDWCYDESPFECLKRSYDNVIARFPNLK